MLKVFLRADATATSGAGHVMRCANLARAFSDAELGTPALMGRVEIPFVRTRLAELGVRTAGTGEDTSDSLVVVDTYDPEERHAYARAPFRCRVLVDDLGGPVPLGYAAVWNPLPTGDASLYPGFNGQVISGAAAVPIREELPHWQAGSAQSEVGVALGGSQVSSTVTDALLQLSRRSPGVPFVAAGWWTPREWQSAPADAVWERLVRCERVLIAAGNTVWEAASVGVPVAVLQLAPNQARVASWVEHSGVAVVRLGEQNKIHELADALDDALSRASPLPRLLDGAPFVARTLARLVDAA